jgi:hypothetical protein
MVPTFTWGFLRSNTPLAMIQILQTRPQSCETLYAIAHANANPSREAATGA